MRNISQCFKVSKFQRCLFGAGVCTLPAGVRICPGRGREEEEEVEKQEEEEEEVVEEEEVTASAQILLSCLLRSPMTRTFGCFGLNPPFNSTWWKSTDDTLYCFFHKSHCARSGLEKHYQLRQKVEKHAKCVALAMFVMFNSCDSNIPASVAEK